jgi:metal-sulfur cluster biosynthetic enzyme
MIMSDPPIANLPDWKIIQSNPDKVNDLVEGLSGITDPEMGLSIIQLGLVRDIEMNSDYALITMILTTPYCPYGPSMLENTRMKVESILSIPTRINYGAIAWEPGMMDQELRDDWGVF